jgi:hypothetical protein
MQLLRADAMQVLPGVIVFLPPPVLVHLPRFLNKLPKQTSADWRLLTISEFSRMFPGAGNRTGEATWICQIPLGYQSMIIPWGHMPLAHRDSH